MEKHGLCCKKSLIKKDVFFFKGTVQFLQEELYRRRQHFWKELLHRKQRFFLERGVWKRKTYVKSQQTFAKEEP